MREFSRRTDRRSIWMAFFIVLWVSANLWSGSVAGQTGESARSDVESSGIRVNSETSKPARELIPTDPVELFLAGGILMWPILAASILAMWIAVERMIVLRTGRVIPRAFASRFVKHVESGKLDQDQALRLCEENGSPMAMVFAHGIRKWGKPSVEVEQGIIDGGERELSHLRKHLSILNGVYTISPLIGLLGTVVGMIMSFNELAAGATMESSSSERLAGGIAVALLTTAAGLAVAIPALVLYMYFVGRVDGLVMEMDRLAQRVVNSISAEALEVLEGGEREVPVRSGRSQE